MIAACLQLCSGLSVGDNLRRVLELATEAVEKGKAQWLVLPENAFCHPYDAAQQPALDRILPRLQQFCREKSVWMFAGSIPVPAPHTGGKVYAELPVINERGEVVARYHKNHLFDVYVAEADTRYCESDTFMAGDKPVVVETPWGRVGLAICYDLRFPEQFLAMEKELPVAFVVPAAFTLHTGQRHWHTLLKARAIDTFSWVLASAQVGLHSNGRATFGHTAIVHPDGNIVAELSMGDGYILHNLDLSIPGKLRSQIPLAAHRR